MYNPFLGHYSMGLGRSLDFLWMKKIVGSGIETIDRIVYDGV